MGWYDTGGWQSRGWGYTPVVGGGGGNVAFDAQAEILVHSVTTGTLSTLTVGSGSHRALIAMLCANGGTLAFTSPAITWNSVSMTQIGVFNDSASNSTFAIFGLVNPASGNNSLVASWGDTRGDCYISAVSYTGVNQTGGATSFPGFVTNIGTSSGSVAITSGASDAAIAVFGSGTSFSSVDHTQVYLDNGGFTIDSGGCRIENSTNPSLGVVLTSGGSWSGCGCSIKAG